MNTAKIAALYPYFLDSLRQPDGAQRLEELLTRRLQAEYLPGSRRCQISLTDMDNPGQPTNWLAEIAGVTIQEFAPERVLAWVRQQVPAWVEEYQGKPATGWQIYLLTSSRYTGSTEPSLHLYASGTSAEFAPVLRGLRAYQAKRRKRARRLLAQLRAYHAQQLTAEARRAGLLVAATTSPLLPHYDITRAEYARRIDAAEDVVEQLRAQHNPAGCYGHEVMWHHDFAAACVASIGSMSLHEVEFFLSGNLAHDLRRGQPLDYADYAYLADCLREGLADNPTPLAALRLARALAWVEQAGAALLGQQEGEARE